MVGLRITWTNGPEIPGGDILETLGIDNACQSAQVIDFPQGRGDRAVEGARLEIVCTPNKGTGGSNPPLSAITKRRVVRAQELISTQRAGQSKAKYRDVDC